jgi:hypothetical protein
MLNDEKMTLPETELPDLSDEERRVYASVKRLASNGLGVNPTTVAYSCPTLDTYVIVKGLVDRRVLELVGAGAVRIADVVPPANADANAQAKTPPIAVTPPVEEQIAEPKRKPPRPYFARLDPSRDMKKQIAARIVQFIAAHHDGDGRVVYMAMYQSLHGARYRNWNNYDLWAEALRYLGRAVRRNHGFIWLDRGTRLISDLPSPYKPLPKFKPRKRKPRTNWFNDVVRRAEANGLSVSEQIAADKQECCNPAFS